MPAAVAVPLIASAIAGGGAIAGSAIGASGAKTAAQQQVDQQDKALQFQQQEYADQKANQAPFVSAGQSSIGQLMQALQSGKLGPGSIPAFQAPTLAEAQQTPGYQFTQQQGEQGIERGAAAAGGAFTGGTLKSLAGFDSGLADSTYNDVFSRALSGYQTTLAAQNQGFNQLASVAGLGENAAANAGNTGAQAANTIGSTFSNIGNAQSAGTVGATNAINNGIQGVVGALTGPYLQNLQSVNDPQNIQNSVNAGYSSIAANGLPGAIDYQPLQPLPPPDFAGAG